jgi:hypothetical protein
VPDIDKRLLIAASIIALVVLGIGFGLGSLAASGDDDAQPDSTSVESGSAPSSETDGSSPTPGATDEPISGDASAAVLPLRTDDSDIPEYGSEEERDEMIAALGEAGVITSNREAILIAADRICYDLERLQAQDRSAAFAVRVVWNESLAELEKEDLAVFSMVFATASFYLCPNSLDYSREVAYWLGF